MFLTEQSRYHTAYPQQTQRFPGIPGNRGKPGNAGKRIATREFGTALKKILDFGFFWKSPLKFFPYVPKRRVRLLPGFYAPGKTAAKKPFSFNSFLPGQGLLTKGIEGNQSWTPKQ